MKMGPPFDIAQIVREHQLPIEFPTRETLEQVLTQRGFSLLLNSGSIRYEPRLANDTAPTLFADSIYAFTSDHPFLLGHWPDFPIVPNHALLEIVGQTASLMLALLPNIQQEGTGGPVNHFHDWVGIFRRISEITFHSNIQPGETILTQAWLDDKKPCRFVGPGLITGTIKGQGRIGRPDGKGGIMTIVVIDVVGGFDFEAMPRQRLTETPS
jgi:3-hydroxymyristoyl/3-hydroxydecanoyl-(acyl carrier protein) dehydratase